MPLFADDNSGKLPAHTDTQTNKHNNIADTLFGHHHHHHNFAHHHQHRHCFSKQQIAQLNTKSHGHLITVNAENGAKKAEKREKLRYAHLIKLPDTLSTDGCSLKWCVCVKSKKRGGKEKRDHKKFQCVQNNEKARENLREKHKALLGQFCGAGIRRLH